MNDTASVNPAPRAKHLPWLMFLAACLLVAIIYWPGLSGGFLFDDYPNIVDNKAVQPVDASLPSLVNAALSSPSSEFKRPLASLSFAANYLATGLDPYWMKLTNLLIHLLNGVMVFLLSRALLKVVAEFPQTAPTISQDPARYQRAGVIAVLVAACWMLLPINLTGVLYVVQRMESLANLFVLLGLLGYVVGRRRMFCSATDTNRQNSANEPSSSVASGPLICIASIIVPTALGLLAKETAVMLPLYAALIEWILFRFRKLSGTLDRGIIALFAVVLLLPFCLGLAWLLPQVASPDYWSTRDFTLRTRLLSEARIVSDYISWTLLPRPAALSFYHDDFRVSTSLLNPWTTLASIAFLAALVLLIWRFRKRQPIVSLGISLFLACQLLTGTILPLELIYEHRNYFASLGLLLAIIPWLAATRAQPLALPRHVLLCGLLILWTTLTAFTAYAWGNPLRLAEDLSMRAPMSPRAQYELGRTYIIYSNYDSTSAFARMAYAPLERAAALPESSILPEQALIFMNARMHLPLKDAWWESLTSKLRSRRAGVQDESSLGALTQCAREHHCDLPQQRMVDAYLAALSHPNPSARLLAMYGDYAWNVIGDHQLGLSMANDAVEASPNEPAYRITQVRMLAASGDLLHAREAYHALQRLNIGGRLDGSLAEFQPQLGNP